MGYWAVSSPRAVVFSTVPLNFLCKMSSVYMKISSKSCEAFFGEGWGPLVPLLSPRGCPGGVPSVLSELALLTLRVVWGRLACSHVLPLPRWETGGEPEEGGVSSVGACATV